jgi:hypothetical protein
MVMLGLRVTRIGIFQGVCLCVQSGAKIRQRVRGKGEGFRVTWMYPSKEGLVCLDALVQMHGDAGARDLVGQ